MWPDILATWSPFETPIIGRTVDYLGSLFALTRGGGGTETDQAFMARIFVAAGYRATGPVVGF